jgi:hypothetical protein
MYCGLIMLAQLVAARPEIRRAAHLALVFMGHRMPKIYP